MDWERRGNPRRDGARRFSKVFIFSDPNGDSGLGSKASAVCLGAE